MKGVTDLKPEFCTVDRLRELFGIPLSTAYKMERDGDIRFVRIRKRGNVGGKTLVDCDSVRAFLKAQMEENPTPSRAPRRRTSG